MRPIPGYPGYYVREDGTVWTEKQLGGTLRQLRPGTRGKGYLHVILSKGTKKSRKSFAVHRLVAEAFIPNPDNLPQVHHMDEDKTNNAKENLEWVTGSRNIKLSPRDRFADKAAHRTLTSALVLEIREKISAGERQKDLALEYNVSQAAISALKTRRSWSTV